MFLALFEMFQRALGLDGVRFLQGKEKKSAGTEIPAGRPWFRKESEKAGHAALACI